MATRSAARRGANSACGSASTTWPTISLPPLRRRVASRRSCTIRAGGWHTQSSWECSEMMQARAVAPKGRKMGATRLLRHVAVALSATLAIACADDPLIEAFNELPIADAKVVLNG